MRDCAHAGEHDQRGNQQVFRALAREIFQSFSTQDGPSVPAIVPTPPPASDALVSLAILIIDAAVMHRYGVIVLRFVGKWTR